MLREEKNFVERGSVIHKDRIWNCRIKSAEACK